jgi:hypothetical protein
VISGPLSQVLVAFTIELDNEFEHRMPHRTARGPAAHSGRGPWLVSLPMWQNYLRWLPDGADQAKLVNLGGLKRWSYVEDDGVTLTRAGRAANKVWTGLPEEIEARWEGRYGDLAPLRAALGEHPDLPWALPVAGPSRVDGPVWTRGPARDLAGRLSQTLQAYARDYERESRLSLAVSANVLRTLTPDGVALRDLPVRTGVSKEAVSVSVGFLERQECATVAGRVARLTGKGERAQAKYRRLVGAERDDRLLAVLEGLLSDPEKLRQGLTPYPDGWRAHPPYTAVTRALLADPAAVLPRYPMVSHRGGFPDGS